ERLHDLPRVGRVTHPLARHVSAVLEESREPVALHGRRADHLGETPVAAAPPHLHLPQPVLRRDVPLGQEKIVSGLRVDVRDAPPIAAHLDGAVQAGDLDGPLESRETGARRIAQRRASGGLRRKRRRESERDRSERGEPGHCPQDTAAVGRISGTYPREVVAVTPNAASKPRITEMIVSSQSDPSPVPRPPSRSTDVISTPGIPHGTIRSNWARSVVTFNANPCHVTHCFTWTPMLAILRPPPPPAHTPASPVLRPAGTPSSASGAMNGSASGRGYHGGSLRCGGAGGCKIG